MDEDLKRFEDKQKLANLQIEKRFVQLEEALDRMKKESGVDTINEIKTSIDEIKNEFADFKLKFQEETKTTRLLQEQVTNKNPQEKMHEFIVKLKQFESSFDQLNLRITSLEKQRLEHPIFID